MSYKLATKKISWKKYNSHVVKDYALLSDIYPIIKILLSPQEYFHEPNYAIFLSVAGFALFMTRAIF